MTRITLRRKVDFSAAHFLPGSGTHCEVVHGHNYLVEAFVTGATDARGMIKPFEEIKRDLKEVVHDRYDHQTLNAVAPFDALSPTTIILSASVQPWMTCVTPKLVGSPRCTELSNIFPSLVQPV